MCHCTESKLSALHVTTSEANKLKWLDNLAVFSVPRRFWNCYCFFLVFEILNFRQINSTKRNSTQDTADHNCKNIRLHVETGGWNTLITASEEFTMAKWGCANVSSNTSSRVWKLCDWNGWRTPRFGIWNLAKLHKNWECAQSTKETFNFVLCIEVQKTFSFPFSLLWHYQMPERFCVKNCCF